MNGPVVARELQVSHWQDIVVEQLGFEPTSNYVEACWLPCLGPTATFLYRRLGSWIAQEPDGFTVDLADLGKSVGVGDKVTAHSVVVRSLDRLAKFHAIGLGYETMAVRSALAPLTARQAERFLTPSLMVVHEEALRVRSAAA